MKSFNKKSSTLSILIILLIGIISCKKEGDEFKVSTYNDTESHNAGQDCMSCHKQDGSGEGWFNIASTVYDSLQLNTYPNNTIRLYTHANGTGTLKYTIQVDGKGNFYSTEDIDFGTGLYPSVESVNGTKYMSSSINSGNCTSCHGTTTGKIWAK